MHRARLFAQAPRRQLLWVTVQDRPTSGDLLGLRGEALQRRRENWLRLHDQQTAGIMGLLPLVRGMAVRFTATTDRAQQMFKHACSTLVGWEIEEVLAETVAMSTAAEVVLKFMPQRLFVQMPKVFGEADADPELQENVYALKHAHRVWHVDKAGQLRMCRHGFELAPDFGGTAHGYCGSTLRACVLEISLTSHIRQSGRIF